MQSAFQFIPKVEVGVEVRGSVQATQVPLLQPENTKSSWRSLCARGIVMLGQVWVS